MFTHLHVHTEYSMLDGLSNIRSLVQQAKALGMDSLAITDHGNLHGAVEFYIECRNTGIKPIIGCEVYVADGSMSSKTPSDKSPYHLTLLAKNDVGYHNLIQLVTKGHLEGFYYKPRIDRTLIEEYHEGIIALSGCPSGEVPRRIIEGRMEDAKKCALWFKEIFGDYYLELQYHENIPELEPLNRGLISLGEELNIPLVLTNDSHYVYQEDAQIQDLLICIHTNTNIHDQKRLRMTDDSYYLRSADEMATLFPDLPQAYNNTRVIADQCHLEMDFSQLHLPEYSLPIGMTSEEYLQKLCWDGYSNRIHEDNPEYEERLQYELFVIQKTNFANYFLVVWDIAAFARDQGILFGVRGSAAASLVLYVLGVTDIDPLSYRLVFERFLNVERKEMPDIDMDFQDDRRDEVLRYITKEYGRDHVAQIITFGTLGPRAALRDTGRALALPYGDVDRVARLVPFGAKALDDALNGVQELRDLYQSDSILRNLIDKAKKLEGVVRHASTHAAGVVISEKPLISYVPLQRPVRGDDHDMAVTQYPMEPIAKLGLLKMDILGLNNLSALDRVLKLISQHRGEHIRLNDVPLDDWKTFDLLSAGKTTGVFQLEGAGMRRYIKDLKPSTLHDVAAMIALYRPGPMEHITTYIQAKHGEIRAEYPHPVLHDILEETYGVIVYQDQVLFIVQALAGYSLGEADTVRKAMGKKIAAIMQEEQQRFIQGALARGFDQRVADQVFELIEPFAGYAFNKAHSVSYALIAYWTAYFKANYPVEYLTALLNSHAGHQERVASVIDECIRLGIKVLPPDINRSNVEFKIDTDPDGRLSVRYGLGAIKHVGFAPVEALVRSRRNGNSLGSLKEFCRNADLSSINRRAMESLVKVGALDEYGARGQLLANIDRILSLAHEEEALRKSGQTTMFDLFGETVTTPLASIELSEGVQVTGREKRIWERDLLGKHISDNLANHIALGNNTETIVFRDELEDSGTRKVAMAGYVLSALERIGKDGRPYVIATLELIGGSVDVRVWADVYQKASDIWAEDTPLFVTGQISNREDRISVNVKTAKLLNSSEGDSNELIPSSETGILNTEPEITLTHKPTADFPNPTVNGMMAPPNVQKPRGDESRAILQENNGSGTSQENLRGTQLSRHKDHEVNFSKTVLIALADSGNGDGDTQLLRAAIQILLEFPGEDAVQLEIASNDKVVRLEMPLVETRFCPELEDRLAKLIGPGQARVV
ncbi:DNA polymerase III subunit alpha [Dehalococcoidia bacterium]|nr:DNA polymerase III subunit alpha [Dehalococcoidia bacterium]